MDVGQGTDKRLQRQSDNNEKMIAWSVFVPISIEMICQYQME